MLRPVLSLLLIAAAPQATQQRGFAVADFDRIRIGGPYDIRVETGLPAAVVAEGSPRALSAVELKVDAGTLSIHPRRDAPGGGEPVRFRVSARALSAATLAGDGRITVDRMSGRDVRLTLNGNGEIEIGTVAAERLTAITTGQGRMALAGAVGRALVGAIGGSRVDGDGLVARDLSVNAQGPAAVTLRATQTARIIAVGGSVIAVRGGARCTVTDDNAEVACGD